MEVLDRHTDQISEKIEKLHLLRTNIAAKPPSWSFTNHSFDRPIFASSLNPLTNDLPTNFDFNYTPSNVTRIPLSTIRDIKHATTQTDSVFCDKCHFPLIQSHMIANLEISMNESAAFHQPQTQNVISHKEEHTTVPDYASAQTNISLPKSATIFPSEEKLEPKNVSSVIEEFQSPILDKSKEFQKEIIISNDNKHVSNINPEQNIKYPSVKESVNLHLPPYKSDFMDENTHPIKNDLPVCDSSKETVSKSDEESLNQEFDFLESDKKSKPFKRMGEQLLSVDNEQINKKVDSEALFVSNEISNSTQEKIVHDSNVERKSNLEVPIPVKDNFGATKIDDGNDNKSESSVSIGRARSPSLLSEKVSAASDSDSLYEKEEFDLRGTAAYQQLLGNISASKNIPKSAPFSESESEDELERVLATGTRKSSNIPVSTTTVAEEKSSEVTKTAPEIKPKPEPRKSISIPSKPQQLSKNTRKVIGLDTSSASEEDLQLKVPTSKKIEEDSDEFFYD